MNIASEMYEYAARFKDLSRLIAELETDRIEWVLKYGRLESEFNDYKNNFERKQAIECKKCREMAWRPNCSDCKSHDVGKTELNGNGGKNNIEENPFLLDIDIYLKVLKDSGFLDEEK